MILTVTLVSAIIGSGGLGMLLQIWINRGPAKAEAAQVLTATALELVEPLKERIRQLELRVAELEAENRVLKLPDQPRSP
jgi:hypothetical protein